MGPRFLEIELTGRCSMGCKHCYGTFLLRKTCPQRKLKTLLIRPTKTLIASFFLGRTIFTPRPHRVSALCRPKRILSSHHHLRFWGYEKKDKKPFR